MRKKPKAGLFWSQINYGDINMVKRKIIRFNAIKQRIICECGTEILLIPDVKAMSEAIEAHVVSHIKRIESSEEKTSEENRIREALVVQVFRISSESDNE